MNIKTYRICKVILAFLFLVMLGYVGSNLADNGRYQFHNEGKAIIDTHTGTVFEINGKKFSDLKR